MDYNLPDCMSFSAGMGNGDTLEFDVSVNSDDLIEWEECIVIIISDPMKSNVLIDGNSNQYKITIDDQDSKD